MSDRPSFQVTLTPRSLLIVVLVNALLLTVIAIAAVNGHARPVAPTSNAAAFFPSSSPQQSDVRAPLTASSTSGPSSAITPDNRAGLAVISMGDNGYAHLFAFQPPSLSFSPLTSSPWDDLTPALSPDGSRLAFASRRNGYWNLYLLDLRSGSLTQLTDSPAYDASPSWSPDGHWLAFENNEDGNLEIFILSVDHPDQPPMRITDDPAADFSPAWSPQGREIAFISDRSGQDEVWIDYLDRTQDRFVKVSNDAASTHAHPAWSRDGTQLAWSASSDGLPGIYVWDSRQPQNTPRRIGSGDWPVWSPQGDAILAQWGEPNRDLLVIYRLDDGDILIPPEPLPGPLSGITWAVGDYPLAITGSRVADRTAAPQTLTQVPSPPPDGPFADRVSLQPLQGVTAPVAMLNEQAIASFESLKTRIAQEIGWDVLSSLENAFVPLTAPLAPNLGDDWLYTGRAFAINSAPLTAGWMALVREDYGAQTYWRVYLKTRYQDGSQGRPLHRRTWNLYARYSGDPSVYEQGGALSSAVPDGYWYDFTALAAQFGWERQPSTLDWRTFFQGARFNEFAFTGGLDWRTAMLQLYPPEALETPTPLPLPSPTPTRTPWWMVPRTPTPTPTATTTSTPRPTWTPLPTP